jgi:2-keto-3-deoxy-L-rhamnonate aldolase RhmA
MSGRRRLGACLFPSLLAVEGVDVFSMGPSDLSQSLGFPGQPDAPVVRAALTQAFAVIHAAGRIAGCAGPASATVARPGQGVRYAYTHLPALLTAGGRGCAPASVMATSVLSQ